MTRTDSRRLVKEASKEANRDHVFYAYLAEDYDGIGQMIRISMARSSTSVGFMAHIASGDFGTGQRIPSGTKVSVLSRRGRIEVLSMGAK